MATWLGWQIESNWTDPLLFATYSIIKPLAGASILVVMYAVITHGNFSAPMFQWIYVGSALYLYVGSIMTGISWGVVDDRERYRMLKYLYAVPTPFAVYLLGRGVSRFITGSFSVWITILFGVIFLKIRQSPEHFHPALFVVGLVLGLATLASMGLVLGAVVLTLKTHTEQLGDAVAGALYLFSGAAFSIAMLPAWLRPLAYALPLGYWLEVMRRSLLGPPPAQFATFAAWSDGQLLLALLGFAAGYALLAAGTLKVCVHSARERGMLDQVSNF